MIGSHANLPTSAIRQFEKRWSKLHKSGHWGNLAADISLSAVKVEFIETEFELTKLVLGRHLDAVDHEHRHRCFRWR